MAKKYDDPRWQRRRLQIMERDGFACTACRDTSSTLHVHHKRYCGDVWESEDADLQTLCHMCHKNLGPHPKAGVWYESVRINDSWCSGKVFGHCPTCAGLQFNRERFGHYRCQNCGWFAENFFRPDESTAMVTCVPYFCGRAIKTFYLAGKITASEWRSSIVNGWADSDRSRNDFSEPVPVVSAGFNMQFVGPWWKDVSGGHCGFEFSNSRPHAGCDSSPRGDVCREIRETLSRSDMLFAWIDSFDCFGTLWELGHAAGAGVPYVVAVKRGLRASLDELWLSFEGASALIEADTAKDAWDQLWFEVGSGLHQRDSKKDCEEDRKLSDLVISRRKSLGLV